MSAPLNDINVPDPSSGTQPATTWCVVALVGLCSVLFLVNTSSLPLADPDEARYAQVTRYMLRDGDWIVPHVAGRIYTSKPAPYFWLTAAGTLVTGDLELGGRLVSAVFGTLAVLVTFAFARSVAGNRAGLLAGVILATSPGPLTLARLYRMDMPLIALMWAALWWFWRHERPGDVAKRQRNRQWVGFYALCACATLMKGPIGLGLPGLVVGAYLLLSGRARRILEVFHLPGIAVYLLIATPWYVAISLRVPQYLQEFFVTQNLVRYAGQAIEKKSFPSIYYVAIVMGCMLPWSIYAPGACIRTFPRRWKSRAADPAMLFGWLAALVPLAFFMLGRTRLAVYVLPVGPPLAAMIAIPLARWVASTKRDPLYRAGEVALLVAVAGMLAALAGVEAHFGWLDGWLALPAAGTLAALVFMGAAMKRGRRGAFLVWAALGLSGVTVFAAEHTAPRLLEERSMASLGRLTREKAANGALVCYFGKRRYSFGLYANRTEGKRFCLDDKSDQEELVGLLKAPKPVFCLVEGKAGLQLLEDHAGRPLTVLGRQDKYCLVTNASSDLAPSPSTNESRP